MASAAVESRAGYREQGRELEKSVICTCFLSDDFLQFTFLYNVRSNKNLQEFVIKIFVIFGEYRLYSKPSEFSSVKEYSFVGLYSNGCLRKFKFDFLMRH